MGLTTQAKRQVVIYPLLSANTYGTHEIMVDTIVKQFYGKRPYGLREVFLVDLHYVLDHPQLEMEDLLKLETACKKSVDETRDYALYIIRKKYMELITRNARQRGGLWGTSLA